MTSANYDVTVVVSTYNRSKLSYTLNALARQELKQITMGRLYWMMVPMRSYEGVEEYSKLLNVKYYFQKLTAL